MASTAFDSNFAVNEKPPRVRARPAEPEHFASMFGYNSGVYRTPRRKTHATDNPYPHPTVSCPHESSRKAKSHLGHRSARQPYTQTRAMNPPDLPAAHHELTPRRGQRVRVSADVHRLVKGCLHGVPSASLAARRQHPTRGARRRVTDGGEPGCR